MSKEEYYVLVCNHLQDLYEEQEEEYSKPARAEVEEYFILGFTPMYCAASIFDDIIED